MRVLTLRGRGAREGRAEGEVRVRWQGEQGGCCCCLHAWWGCARAFQEKCLIERRPLRIYTIGGCASRLTPRSVWGTSRLPEVRLGVLGASVGARVQRAAKRRVPYGRRPGAALRELGLVATISSGGRPSVDRRDIFRHCTAQGGSVHDGWGKSAATSALEPACAHAGGRSAAHLWRRCPSPRPRARALLWGVAPIVPIRQCGSLAAAKSRR